MDVAHQKRRARHGRIESRGAVVDANVSVDIAAGHLTIDDKAARPALPPLAAERLLE